MDKLQLSQIMQEIDLNLQSTRRQMKADLNSLQAAHQLFDEIEGFSLEQMAMLNGELSEEQKQPLVIKARLLEGGEDW